MRKEGDIELLATTGGGRATLLLRISASRSCVSGPSPASTTFGKSRCVESDAARDGGIEVIDEDRTATDNQKTLHFRIGATKACAGVCGAMNSLSPTYM